MTDPMEKATAGDDLVGKIQNSVAGFFGYYDRERRRDADKMLRDTIAKRYREQLRRVNDIQAEMASSGMLAYVDDLDKAAVKLRTLIDRVRTAPRGYAGYFDAVRINQDELDRMYEYDLAVLDNVEQVENGVTAVEAELNGENLMEAIKALVSVCQDALDAYSRRSELVLTEEES